MNITLTCDTRYGPVCLPFDFSMTLSYSWDTPLSNPNNRRSSVCGLNKCDLFVYSPVENGSYIITVDRDELFIQEAVQKAEELYFSHFLPILVSKKNDENEKKKGFE